MEPLTIHVEVNLGEKTLNILQNLLQLNTTRAAAPAAAPAASAPAAPAATAKEDPNNWPPKDFNDDLPGDITDEELRAAVKAAKDATSAADVKKIFGEFGIKTSSECPDDKRSDLLKKLVELTNAK